MLISGNKVLIRENGTQKLVDDLMISDLVYDPWAQKYIEIVDILSRTVDLYSIEEAGMHPLHPIVLEAGSIAKSRPREDLLLSPSQVIYHVVRSPNLNETPLLRKSKASLIGSPLEKKGKALKAATYFAIFTEVEQTMEVSGVLLKTYSSNIYED